MSVAKEEIPKLLAELVGIEQNKETMDFIERFLMSLEIPAGEARNMARCLHWLDGMRAGIKSRADQIKSELPTTDQEIQLGSADKAGDKDVAMGQVEMAKGEPVLGA